jgi:hypothetical protein
MVEHIAQVVQKFVLHITPGHGLMGQLDLEHVHFAFNLFYLSTLVAVMIGWFYYSSQVSKKWKAFSIALVFTVACPVNEKAPTNLSVYPSSLRCPMCLSGFAPTKHSVS